MHVARRRKAEKFLKDPMHGRGRKQVLPAHHIGDALRGIISDKSSPLVYGYDQTQIPVYFNQSPVINAGGTPNAFAFGGGARPGTPYGTRQPGGAEGP